ncbi:hypothetical protein EDB80DRAFT_823282 [Ilyonectria destructans]|nr:hypothetical protein EDB80DRAFT_823282 [Ilyonectria destructans]
MKRRRTPSPGGGVEPQKRHRVGPKPGGLKRKHSGGERIKDSKKPKRGGTGPGNTPRHEMTSAGPPATSPNKKCPGSEAEHSQPSGPGGREGQTSKQGQKNPLKRMLTPGPETEIEWSKRTRLGSRRVRLKRKHSDSRSINSEDSTPDTKKSKRESIGSENTSCYEMGSAGPSAILPNKKCPPKAECAQPSGPGGREGQASEQGQENPLKRKLTPPPEDETELPKRRLFGFQWVRPRPTPNHENGGINELERGRLKRKHSGGGSINSKDSTPGTKKPKRGGIGSGNTPRHEMTSAGPPATSPNKKCPGPEAEHSQPSGPEGREGQTSKQGQKNPLKRMLTPPPEDGTRLPKRSCPEGRTTNRENGGGSEPRPGGPKRERDDQSIDVCSAPGTGGPDLRGGNQLPRKRERNDGDNEIDRGRSKLPRLGFGGEHQLPQHKNIQQPESSEVRVDDDGKGNSDGGPSDQNTHPISGEATSYSGPEVQGDFHIIKDTRGGLGRLGKLTQRTKTLFFQPLVNFLKTPINPLSRWFARRRK